MRVSANLYDTVNAAISQSEQQLQSSLSQLSSGKRVPKPSDDPLAFASNLQSLATSARVDTYTKNSDSILSQAQMADSALSSVTTCLTQALSIGTEAGNSTLTSAQRSSLAQQMQGLMDQVVAQANSTGSNGQPLFAGTASTSAPFVPDATSPNGYIYRGNSESNQAQVGDYLNATVNIPGDTIFTSATGNVLGSMQQMISAVSSGSSSDLATATAAISAAISHVSSVRASYGNTVDQLQSQTSFLSQETISLSSQQALLVDVDTATAATDLTQAQTQNSAILAVAAKLLPQSLLQYLK